MAEAKTFSGDWAALVANFNAKLPRGWNMFQYEWAADAATGPALFGDEPGIDAKRNACEAALIGHLHGRHLGELLREKTPALQNIHLIAHSAGAWVAYSAAKYILDTMPQTKVQVTLLDPFMPNECGQYSGRELLGKKEIVAIGVGKKIYRLENYYVANDITGEATRQVFNFPWQTQVISSGPAVPRDINLQVDILVRDQSMPDAVRAYSGHPGQTMTPSAAIPAYTDHSGPIKFYAESIMGSVKWAELRDYGWGKSMAAQDGK